MTAHSTRAIPINAYHLKFRLSKKTFFGSALPEEIRIFLISKPFPAMPITNKAIETNDNTDRGMTYYLVLYNLKTGYFQV